ncbi:DUF2934 domain-containing protein [Roseomonas sp. SSH11]|uniref:DUF2934 domain-containing protein n=2 Tax=Pararoseomonas baculiformis TaxID=2820812 RepID=A0ABS4ALD9_9PROT|nr:DUF2934 domain-containing protein [Pararoseomonas baculiformis]
MMSDDHRIRERAHQIWEQAGRPDGQHESHWAQAEREVAATDNTPPIRQDDDANGAASPTLNAPDQGGASPGEAAAAVKALNDLPRGTGGKERQR